MNSKKFFLIFVLTAMILFFVVGGVSAFSATGGTITYSGEYTIHTFTTSGTFNVTSGDGNVVLDLDNNFKIRDTLKGDIVVNQGENSEAIYGLILLTKDNFSIITETFNLKNVLVKDDFGKNIIKIEDLVNYQFTEVGEYELLFPVLDLDINIKKEILVK